MSIRKFIFCDICNPQGLRSIEFRRSTRIDERNGRRISDGRAWFEGDVGSALKNGWQVTPEGTHICPACQK
ncbi:MAG: hypothetical protein Q7U98_13550 [Methylicorpusculum sp.]|uniref:hypothetical protein n=1 Tax=Methylicorpusculum sp. TaxID=2713644 RepID=UPI00271FB6C3|nr:hypothetical protein [Methylicorpusculum sp.]MDO8842980.1 hypothetical protein [Methylicorpusculum sp.]MDO8940172.1 hypothetical protein [Methylicorpusculum sp.]MDP2179501.1 hypothetical protein [Methylicorpusculum sp.]MDP2202209.1 hypothetical protein [Methylicorpusculum sp.]MDP3529754.1 hypothetical protein [Methylicorpusculum sp.]